jgi:hypothetical protein
MWYGPPHNVDTGNQGYPLAIARLDSKWLDAPIRCSNNFNRPSYTHLKACFVKVVGIFVPDTILGFDVAYKVEPGTDYS